jgi:hypothetical protein
MREMIFVPMAVGFGAVCLWLAARIVESGVAWAKWTLGAMLLSAAFVWLLNNSLSPPLFDFDDHFSAAPEISVHGGPGTPVQAHP